jgi:hypothetical protein
VLIQRPAVRLPDGGLAYPAPLHVNRVQDLPAEVELAGHGYGDIKAVRARLDREAGAKQAEADLAAETAAKVDAEAWGRRGGRGSPPGPGTAPRGTPPRRRPRRAARSS